MAEDLPSDDNLPSTDELARLQNLLHGLLPPADPTPTTAADEPARLESGSVTLSLMVAGHAAQVTLSDTNDGHLYGRLRSFILRHLHTEQQQG